MLWSDWERHEYLQLTSCSQNLLLEIFFSNVLKDHKTLLTRSCNSLKQGDNSEVRLATINYLSHVVQYRLTKNTVLCQGKRLAVYATLGSFPYERELVSATQTINPYRN